LAAHALLQHTITPTREDIVEAISGNICRCTGYGQIVEAVQFAADRLRKANTPRPHNGAPHHTQAEHDAPVEGVLAAAAADEPVVEPK
jgi:carbon-monoxide dehydrogenase small subunit